MSGRVIVPAGWEIAASRAGMSPAVLSGGFLFLTGVTGSDAGGAMPTSPKAQFRAAFDKIGNVLDAAGVGFDAVVEMTTYHIGLRRHFDLFDEVRKGYFDAPYPAWTAVEVAGLRREGAVVEIRTIARAAP